MPRTASAVVTYFEVLAPDGLPSLAQRRKLGTRLYGYPTVTAARAAAHRSGMPEDSAIRERHTDGSDDWSGRVVSTVGPRRAS